MLLMLAIETLTFSISNSSCLMQHPEVTSDGFHKTVLKSHCQPASGFITLGL